MDALPLQATKAHLFPSLGPSSLVSIGQLCDAGCTAKFHHDKVHIKYHGDIIITGLRNNATNKLWQLNLNEPRPEPTIQIKNSPVQQQGNLAIIKDSAKASEMVRFSHATLFSPVPSMLNAALQKGSIKNFPGLTSKTLNKYPPNSTAMAKGHLKQVRQQKEAMVDVSCPTLHGWQTPSEAHSMD